MTHWIEGKSWLVFGKETSIISPDDNVSLSQEIEVDERKSVIAMKRREGTLACWMDLYHQRD